MNPSKIKQNKNTHSILYHVLVWIIALAFVLALFFFPDCFDILSIPAFAATNPESTNGIDFSDQPIPYFSSVPTGDQLRSSGIHPFDGSAIQRYFGSSNDNSYMFAYPSGTVVYTVICSDSSFSLYLVNDTNTSVSTYNSTLNSDYALYVYPYSGSASQQSNYIIPMFASLADGLDAVNDWIVNGGSSDTLRTVSFSLPSGNIAFVDLGSTTYNRQRHYTGSCDFEYLSNIFNGGFQYNTGKWGYSSSLPSSSQFSYPTSSIEWSKSGKLNWLGQSQYGTWSQTSTASSRYLVIYNPVNELSMLSDGVPREAIYYLSIPEAVSVRVYPLTVNSTFENNIFTQTDTLDTDDYFDGDVDPDTGVVSWTDANGDSSSGPVFGGNTNVGSNAETIFDLVRNIAEEIRTFLSGSVSSVRTLINSASDFFHSLSDLYVWLPAPVYSVLISALVIAITIGVIKIFI